MSLARRSRRAEPFQHGTQSGVSRWFDGCHAELPHARVVLDALTAYPARGDSRWKAFRSAPVPRGAHKLDQRRLLRRRGKHVVEPSG